MNNIAIALIIIGVLEIIGGFVIGIATNNVLLWIWAGIVSGIIMFGFAEMINLLQQNRDIAKEQLGVLKGKFLPQNEHSSKDAIAEDNQSQEKDDGYDELRKELKEQGHDHDYIEATVAIRKRMGKK